MPRQGSIIGRAIDAAAEAVVLADLAEPFMPLLQDAIGGAAAMLFEFDERGRPRGVSGSLAPHLARYNASLLGADPLQHALRRIDPGPTTLVLEDVLDVDALRASAAFRDFYRPLGVERLLGLWPTNQRFGSPGMVGLIVGRPHADRPFGARERKLLECVLPALRAVITRDRRTRAGAWRGTLATVAHAHGLTRAEAEVLACVARGLDNRAIAAELGVAEATVKTHLRRVLAKLDVDSRTQAALLAHGVLPGR